MSTNAKSERPLFRVTFSRITGKDDKGNDVLAKPKEIGAIWSGSTAKPAAFSASI